MMMVQLVWQRLEPQELQMALVRQLVLAQELEQRLLTVQQQHHP
jgi:hypothetical protein